MQGFIYAAQHIAKERADLGWTAEYWYGVLCDWKKELETMDVGSFIGTAGFILRKEEEGCYELTRNVISFYDGEEPFYWIDKDLNGD